MHTIDIAFLAVVGLSLGTMLASSRVIRAIVWDSFRHPFTHATIIIDGDRVEVRHEPALDE